MANRIDGTTNTCIFQWKIENISHCWAKVGEKLDSPKFIADTLQGTKWFLRVYPSSSSSKGCMAFHLRRDEDCVGPDFVVVNFKIALLDKDGTYLKERKSICKYPKNSTFGFSDFEEREKIFVTHREAFLPEDTLTVQCTILKAHEETNKTEHLFARTRFRLKRRNFLCRIEEFSSLKCDKKHTFKESLIKFDLGFQEALEFGKKLVMNINSTDEKIKYFSFKASIIDSGGEKEICCTQEYFEGDLKKGVMCTLLCAKQLMENRSRYLPNDVLSLDCEYSYSNGTISYEQYGCGIIIPKPTKELAESVNNNIVKNLYETDTMKKNSKSVIAIAKDLVAMYNDKILCDIEIRTSTQAFPAHKIILCARSPVFRKMFSNDMKENISGYVDIDDLEDDTVHQMLLYMYTDTLDALQYENAYKLYMAADKYEILSLRDICASFVKNNLCPKNACDALALSDRHQDEDLKSAVQNFVLMHDKEIFGSCEWKDFMNSNCKLASDMMYLFTMSKL